LLVISRPSSHVLGVGHIAMEEERIPAQAPPFLLPLLPPLRCGCSGQLRHNLALRAIRRPPLIPVPLPVTHATSSEDANFFTPNGTHVPFFSV
jgi:hypothetical protein